MPISGFSYSPHITSGTPSRSWKSRPTLLFQGPNASGVERLKPATAATTVARQRRLDHSDSPTEMNWPGPARTPSLQNRMEQEFLSQRLETILAAEKEGL